VIGLAMNVTGVNPIKALVFAAVFNGIIAVPLIWFIDRIAADRDTMG
jgi:ABC-type transporter Mla maintaining outer membrane lipid asymmetry permease subunit MlaE